MNAYGEAQWLLLAAQGDEAAFRQLFNVYWPQVYGTALKLTRSPEWAADLAQDIFLKLWNNRSDLSEVKKVDAYIYVLSRNFIMDTLRKKVFSDPHMQYLLEYARQDSDTAQEAMELREREHRLREEIQRLPGKVGEVVRLKYFEGLSHREIAERLGISVVSSKTYVVRAMQELRKLLSGGLKFFFLFFVFLLLCFCVFS